MKKLISYSLAAILCTASAFAQDTKPQEPKQKTSEKKIKEEKQASLDGRSFKISFTERQIDSKPILNADKETVKNNGATPQTAQQDYSTFDVNSKVIITFANGQIMSPIFAGGSCPYRLNTSGNDMYAFSSYCRLNSGNEKVNSESQPHDTKMEVEAANAANKKAAAQEKTDVINPPATMPPDETKQHLPPGTARDDNAGMNNTPPAGNVPPTMQSEQIQRQAEPPAQTQSGYMATISGVVSGNSIQGTLSWTAADGKKMSYSYSGTAATKKDTNDSRMVGLK